MDVMKDPSSSITQRYRALYQLKETEGDEGRKGLVESLELTKSVLLLHEICFSLGQRGDKESIEVLEKILMMRSEHNEVTRHEAAEALGAIGDERCLPLLKQYWDDEEESQAVRETCELAYQRILLLKNDPNQFSTKSPFSSVDPTPSFLNNIPPSTKSLEEILCDEDEPLFDRYRAMFSLRNIGTPEAIASVGKALLTDKKSALFRHELAYILGQLEKMESVESLTESLARESEHPMVRHESAEALGAIATPAILKNISGYTSHKEPLVSESCTVALDMADYWSNWKPDTTAQ
eukprot:TRINITY_DN7134_c0_g1_i1.p1 TRINITY_DN7134_c0_g1~~TRINITY_DN7134_c0_g1_i1.p1  ORF type:complete len:294 (+),score=54.14 TRINITY_DN7134_c0_g1_i1:44-925(+)